MGLIGFGTLRGIVQSQFFIHQNTKGLRNENERTNYR